LTSTNTNQRTAIQETRASSYGGYAALCAATVTPERFTCALAACAPANLLTLLRAVPPHPASRRAMLHRRIGHPDTDADMLWARSPLSRAHDLSIPLLLAQSADDPRVTPAESAELVAVLRDRGLDHDHLVFEGEGGRLTTPANRMRLRAAAEAFLARHLAGG
ncbi:MAG: prolyl oligopeptidase family serine peptidase, partial [Egibacteraceae bacterium]